MHLSSDPAQRRRAEKISANLANPVKRAKKALTNGKAFKTALAKKAEEIREDESRPDKTVSKSLGELMAESDGEISDNSLLQGAQASQELNMDPPKQLKKRHAAGESTVLAEEEVSGSAAKRGKKGVSSFPLSKPAYKKPGIILDENAEVIQLGKTSLPLPRQKYSLGGNYFMQIGELDFGGGAGLVEAIFFFKPETKTKPEYRFNLPAWLGQSIYKALGDIDKKVEMQADKSEHE